MWDKEKSSKAYPNRDDFVRDCVPILRRELELLRDAGATIIEGNAAEIVGVRTRGEIQRHHGHRELDPHSLLDEFDEH